MQRRSSAVVELFVSVSRHIGPNVPIGWRQIFGCRKETHIKLRALKEIDPGVRVAAVTDPDKKNSGSAGIRIDIESMHRQLWAGGR